jgi:hypothetical protein
MATQEITIYRHVNYQGARLPITNSIKDLKAEGFADIASSCKLSGGGAWLLYEHPAWQGKESYVNTDVADFNKIAIGNDTLSSLHKIPADDGKPTILLFQDTFYRGEMLVVKSADKNLGTLGFNDDVSSLIVVNGTWQLYQDTGFGGQKWEVSAKGGPTVDGRYPNSTSFGKDVISSVKPK